MPSRREGLTHPPRSLLLAASLYGCVLSYRDLGETVLTAGVALALIGGALVASLQWIWSPLLPPPVAQRRAVIAAVLIGAVAMGIGSGLTSATLTAHPEGPSAARAWFERLHIGTQFFGASILAWTLVAWRVLVRVRPQRAALAVPVTLALSAALALLAAVLGGRRALPDPLFYFLYWSGTLGVVPAALWCVLALEGVLRRRALPRKE